MTAATVGKLSGPGRHKVLATRRAGKVKQVAVREWELQGTTEWPDRRVCPSVLVGIGYPPGGPLNHANVSLNIDGRVVVLDSDGVVILRDLLRRARS